MKTQVTAVAISAEESLRNLDPHTALKLFESADPADTGARCGQIRALWALRRADEARVALDALPPEGRASAPGQAATGTIALGLRDSLLQLDIHAGSAGRDDQAALGAFAAAVRQDPQDPVALRGLATAHRLAGQPAEARAVIDKAISGLGPQPGLLAESAWCHSDLGDTEEALAVLDSAPEDIEVLFAAAAILDSGQWPPDAGPFYERLRRLVPETSAALHVQLAQHLRSVLFWTAPGAERVAAMNEIHEHARQALLLLPGQPMVLDCLSYMSYVQKFPLFSSQAADEVVARDLHDDPDLPESPAILTARYWAALREGHLAGAVAHARRARVIDPNLLSAAVTEVDCLIDLGCNREAEHAARAVLQRRPGLQAMRYQLARAEAARGRHEEALELLPGGDSPSKVLEKIELLRELGDFPAAEALAGSPPRPFSGEWERRLRLELVVNSTEQSHWKQAAIRLDALLALDPGNEEFRGLRRAVARSARFGLGRRPPSEDTDAAIADTRNLTFLLDDLLPDDSPVSLRARLHQIHRRQRAIQEDAQRFKTTAVAVSVLPMLVLLVLSHRALRALGASGNTLLADALLLAEIAAVVLVIWLAGAGRVSSRAVLAGATLAGYGALAAALLSGHGHPGTLWLFPSLALAFAATSFWVLVLLAVIARQATVAQSRRQRRDDRFGYLVHDLLDLLELLEYEPGLIRPEVQRECLALLERVARGQEHVLTAAVKSGGGVIEEPTEHAFRRHVAGVVSATRDLKRDVLSPGPRTWETLRARLGDDLAATCRGYWNLLPYRTPDPPGKVLRIKLLSGLRSLLVLATPPALLYLLSAARLLPAAPPQSILLIGYLGWPALVLMLWLDPQLAAKVSLVKSAGDAVSAFKQDKSAM